MRKNRIREVNFNLVVSKIGGCKFVRRVFLLLVSTKTARITKFVRVLGQMKFANCACLFGLCFPVIYFALQFFLTH